MEEAFAIIDLVMKERFTMKHVESDQDGGGSIGSYIIEYKEYKIQWDYHYAIDLISVSNETHGIQEDGSEEGEPLYLKIKPLITAYDNAQMNHSVSKYKD